jgi:hypothetical protein
MVMMLFGMYIIVYFGYIRGISLLIIRRLVIMINFDEEIEKFQPSLEIEQAEDVINNNDLTDITDILKELLKGNKEN